MPFPTLQSVPKIAPNEKLELWARRLAAYLEQHITQFMLLSQRIVLANGDNHNVDTKGAMLVHVVGPTGAFGITGIAKGSEGRILVLHNDSSGTMTLKDVNVGSAVGNRIVTGAGTDISVGICLLVYDQVGSSWYVLGGGSGGGGPPGPTGPTGPTGPQGIPGIGLDGQDGLDGEMGPPGSMGPTGTTGAAGADGSTGPAGAPGLQGIPGLDGVDGEDGFIGPPGVAGAAGVAGATGPSGDIGQTGSPGLDGLDGEDSLIPGPRGETGPAGATGSTGSTGATGPIGERGIPGFDGLDGDDGYGFPGPQGLQGRTGDTGADGAAGARGAIGPVGPWGLDGTDGEDSWIPGPQGLRGIQGIQGPAGSGGSSAGPPGMDGIDSDDWWTPPYSPNVDGDLTISGRIYNYPTVYSRTTGNGALTQNAVGWFFQDFSGNPGFQFVFVGTAVLGTVGVGGTGTNIAALSINSGSSGTTAPSVNLQRAGASVATWTYNGTDTFFDYTGNLSLRTSPGGTVKANFDTNGMLTEYRDQALAGNGVGSILASVALTGQSANIAATNLVAATAAAGLYKVSIHYCTTTTGNSVTITGQINYTTDATNAAVNFTGGTIAIQTANAKIGTVFVIQARSGTAITYQTNQSGALGTGRYALYITLERLT